MISEELIDQVREQLKQVDRYELMRRMSREEPDLHYAISQIAIHALSGVDHSTEAETVAHQAVWWAVNLALEAYRVAHYRLWKETTLIDLIERLDPRLAKDYPPPQLAEGEVAEEDEGIEEDE